MAKSTLPLTGLRAFEAAARHLSFTKAADELRVTQGAVSQQIAFLEQRTGVSLFERRPRKLLLTHKGELLAAALGSAFDQMDAALIAVSQYRIDSKALRVMSYPTLAAKFFIPRLPRFYDACREIELQMTTRIRPADFEADAVDVAVREGTGGWAGMRCDRMFSQTLLPVCSPQYLENHRLDSIDDLKSVHLLNSVNRLEDWVLWLSSQGYPSSGIPPMEELGNSGLAYMAAIAGRGVAMAQYELAYDDLASGRLIAPFTYVVKQSRHYYLISPSSRADHPAVAAFREWVLEELESYRTDLERDFPRLTRSGAPALVGA